MMDSAEPLVKVSLRGELFWRSRTSF